MAIRFDAVGDVVVRTTGVPAFGDLTRMCWLYRAADMATNEAIFFVANSASYTTYMGLYLSSATAAVQPTYNLTGFGSATGTVLSLTTWYHVATVFDNTADTYKAYLNGVLDATVTSVAGSAVWAHEAIGNLYASSTARINGRIGAYKSWTAVLTADEIKQEMWQYVPVRLANIASWAPLRDATDLGDFANGVTFTGSGALVTEDGPPIVWSRRSLTYRWRAAALPYLWPSHTMTPAVQRAAFW